MDISLLVATLAGLGGMLGWGFADFFAKKTIDQIGDVVTLVWGHIFGTLLVVLIALYLFIVDARPLAVPTHISVWAGLAFFGVLQAIVYLLVYRGFGKGQLALLNPIFASYSGVVAVFSIALLGEIVTGHIVLAILTVFIGVLMLNIDGNAFRSGRINFLAVPGFFEVASAAVLAAVWTLGWDQFIIDRDWLSYAVYMYLFMSAALLFYVAVRKISLRGITQPLYIYVILIGVCESLAYVAISWGYGVSGHASVVALFSGAFSLPTILLSRAFLHEKTSRLQTIGSLVIIAGIIFLAVQ